MSELVDLLGQRRDSAEVLDAVLQFGLDEVTEDPPSHQYLMSRR
jgi:hypothetical protein